METGGETGKRADDLASPTNLSGEAESPAQSLPSWAGGAAAMMLLMVVLNLLFANAVARSGWPALLGLSVGAVGGQFGLLAFGAVFAPQSLIVRWTISLAAQLLLLGTILLGAALTFTPDWRFWQFVTTSVLLLPLVSLAAQCPLVAFKLLGRLRFRHISRAKGSCRPDPLSVKKLMLATVVVAVCLSLARIALEDVERDWPSLAISCAVICIGSALTIPVMWVCLSGYSAGTSASLSLIYAGLLAAVSVTLLAVLAGNLIPGAVAAVVTIHLGVAAVLVCGLLPLRASGYRLVADKRQATDC